MSLITKTNCVNDANALAPKQFQEQENDDEYMVFEKEVEHEKLFKVIESCNPYVKCVPAFQLEQTIQIHASTCNVHPEFVYVDDRTCRRVLRLIDNSQVVLYNKAASTPIPMDVTQSL